MGAVVGTVAGVVRTAGGVVTVVWTGVVICTVVGAVVGTVAGGVVATVVGDAVRVFTVMSGFLSWSSRPSVGV
jgi:GMP synthase PP-ATPase subunit